jgi:UDP-N-acetylbacillosamine N-acetyltransferase
MSGLENAIVIVGAGGHAMVVADLAELSGYSIVGFIDDVNVDRRGVPFCRATVLGGAEQLPIVAAGGVRSAVVAVGDCAARLALAERARALGLDLTALCHPTAAVARDSTIGPGTVVMAGAVVNPGAFIGSNVIVNTAASVDHECHIDDGVHVGPGVRLGGRVHVGRGTWLGIGSVVKDGIRIGAGTIVGAGSLVLRDLPGGIVAFGSPATIVRPVHHAEALSR